MSAEIIRFDEAARRVRDRRNSGGIAGSDLFWIAATCCWPISLALFAAQAMDAGRLVALNVLTLLIFVPQHVSACRRLSRIREAAEDYAVARGGHLTAIMFGDACFTAAEGSRS